MKLTEKEIERFWSKFNKDECWTWSRGTNNGYGWFGIKRLKKNFYAHRLSWQLTNGEIRDGLCVLHKCDNRLCGNPSHLFIGTIADNMHDKVLKGRQIKGSEVPSSKLTEHQVLEIKTLRPKTTIEALSLAYNVSKSTIINICMGRGWKHVNI